MGLHRDVWNEYNGTRKGRLIKLTKLNQSEIFLNADQIESIEANPDTGVLLLNGKRLVVRESVEQVVQRVIEYKRMVNGRISINNGEDNTLRNDANHLG